MTNTRPFAVKSSIVVPLGTPVEALFQAVHDALSRREGFDATDWTSLSEVQATSVERARRPGMPPRDVEADILRQGFGISGAHSWLTVKHLAGGPLTNVLDGHDEVTGWWIAERCYAEERPVTQVVQEQCAMVRALASAFSLVGAHVIRESKTFLGPCPPLAEPEYVLLCTTTAAVEAAYAHPAGFWAAWDTVDPLESGHVLVTRGTAIADETAYKAHVLHAGFELGRAARPGLTGYYVAEPSPDEAAMLKRAPRYLHQVGYDAAAATLEFTAVVPDEAWLTPADILSLLDFQSRGTADGGAVDVVIVTFPNRAMAARHAQLLWDVEDVRVQYLEPGGDWTVLEEPAKRG